MATPTPDQLTKVRTNLTNMQDFNDSLHPFVSDKIQNAYLLLTEPDQSDKGLAYVLNLFEAAFKTMGGILGPGGVFVSNFLVGMMGYWTSDPPGILNGQFAHLIDRVSTTFQTLDQQLADYWADLGSSDPTKVQAAWDTQFTFNGESTSVGDLVNTDFPPRDTPGFVSLRGAAIFAWDQLIWQQMLTANYIVPWDNFYRTDCTDQNQPPIGWVQNMLADYKFAYYTWFWHEGDGGDCSLWIAYEYVVRKNVTGFYMLNDDCCQYIFIDSTAGTIINPNGLFTRQQVVDFLGIHYKPNNDLEEAKEYAQAEKEGRTLLALYQSQGRETIEKKVTEKALADAKFAMELYRNPKKTVETFFNIKVPQHVKLTVVVEDPMNFGLVIKNPKNSGG